MSNYPDHTWESISVREPLIPGGACEACLVLQASGSNLNGVEFNWIASESVFLHKISYIRLSMQKVLLLLAMFRQS